MDRSNVNALVQAQTNMIVQSGPFSGMIMTSERSWSKDGDITPKLLGTYEQELHKYLVDFSSQRYSAIVDIGCAEGYYAVGAARLFPGARVYAFDTNERAIEVLRIAAELNKVSDRVITGTFCSGKDLSHIAVEHQRLLVICDCEGYESELLRDAGIFGGPLQYSDFIIECHDFRMPTSTVDCTSALIRSHLIEMVYSSGRNPNAFPFLSHLRDLDRWMAVCENRPCLMNWIVARSRKVRG